jgi:hypothetical protein
MMKERQKMGKEKRAKRNEGKGKEAKGKEGVSLCGAWRCRRAERRGLMLSLAMIRERVRVEKGKYAAWRMQDGTLPAKE